MDWLERFCTGDVIRMHHHFDITRLEIFHAAFEHDPAAIDKDEIGQDILDFFDLMRRDNDGATAVEVIVEQRIVELFSIKNVESERRFVQHKQLRIDRHDQREMELRDHAFG